MLKIGKRQRFIVTSALLTIGLLVSQLVGNDLRYMVIAGLAFAAYLLSIWSLREDLAGIEFFTLLFLPVAFSVSTAFFYFLLPVRWLTRLPVAIFFVVGIYSLLLTENIYNVAAIRTIQLIRAAHAVGYFLTLVTAFFIFDVIFSLHLPAWVLALALGLISFPLILQNVWTIDLPKKISSRLWWYSAVSALILAQMALAISFWPLRVSAVGALFLVTILYILLGIIQHYFNGRLNQRTTIEYLLVGLAVFVITFLTTRWG